MCVYFIFRAFYENSPFYVNVRIYVEPSTLGNMMYIHGPYFNQHLITEYQSQRRDINREELHRGLAFFSLYMSIIFVKPNGSLNI